MGVLVKTFWLKYVYYSIDSFFFKQYGTEYGFFGIKVGANWLDTAGKLESQGFSQAGNLERFTKPGSDFSISIYLYPDDSSDVQSSKVRDYSVCARYGSAL